MSMGGKQAGTGPSRRHIQGSKIAKRLPSVKYSLLQYSKVVYEFPIRTSQMFFFKKNVDYFFKNFEYQTNREFGPVEYIF